MDIMPYLVVSVPRKAHLQYITRCSKWFVLLFSVAKCLEVFHRTLNLLAPTVTTPTGPGSVALRDLTVYSLMFSEAGRTLLDIIGTGVDTIETVLTAQGR